MDRNTLIAALVAPVVGPFFYWAWRKPGRMVHDWLWVHLPDGRLRTILLKRIKYID